jgi:D-3-phosphoglycerate dehydrogenase / 2-oxoglutarate reductase
VAAARRILAADRAERAGKAGFRDSSSFTELSGGTALIVGWGATGSLLGAMLHHALGMRILAHSPRPPTEPWAAHAPDLGAALAKADLVSLHAPLRPETRHFMGPAAFAAIRPGAILVNVARAGLVDEAALLDALAAGRLGGAALDVASPETPRGPLAAFDTIIFTPHLGGTTEAALRRTAETAATHVIAALSGRMPPTAINPEVWEVPA